MGPGWYPLLVQLDNDLVRISPQYEVQQCKAKFGGLRFYAEPGPDDSGTRDAFAARIREAEQQSERTCEDCGDPGGPASVNGWRWTLCLAHEQARRTNAH